MVVATIVVNGLFGATKAATAVSAVVLVGLAMLAHAVRKVHRTIENRRLRAHVASDESADTLAK
jgi:hypothetical protein